MVQKPFNKMCLLKCEKSVHERNNESLPNGVCDTSFKRYLLLGSVLLIGTFLRFYHLSYRSLWFDEVVMYFVSIKKLHLIEDLGHPPLSHYIHHFFLLFGSGETILRLPPAIFGIATIYLVYLLGKELYDFETGLICALITSISPFLIYYSQEARMYSQFVFFSVASLLSLIYFVKKQSLVRYIIYVLVTLLCLYTHFFAVILLLSENIFILFLWLRRKFNIKNWFKAQILITLFYLPGIFLFFNIIKEQGSTHYSIFKTILGAFYIFTFGKTFFPVSLNAIVVAVGSFIFFACICLGIIELINRRNRNYFFFLSFFLILIIILLANYRFKALNEESIHYIIFMAPLYFILVSRGLIIARYSGVRFLFGFVIILVSASALFGYYFNWENVGKANFKSAAAFLREQGLNNEDLIVCSANRKRESPKNIPIILEYYLKEKFRYKVIQPHLHEPVYFDDVPNRIIIVGLSWKFGVEVIKSQSVESAPWQNDLLENEILKLGFKKKVRKSWVGKQRIDIVIFEKRV